ncbi:phosphate ABC transporter permease subunit PstC [Cognatishimia sp. WU-CL00825]|uniref:phosphate ABC transporter permease subunit PstC n=1 Tax=Cognatishimia sp. WU-CL00825 TaxID=3127658 RepID=UPI003106B88E
MPILWLVLIVMALATTGFFAGRMRALRSAQGDSRNLHSLPNYYGFNVAISVLVPSFLLLAVWAMAQPMFVDKTISATLPDTAISQGSTLGLVMSDVRRVAQGLDLAVQQGVLTTDQARDFSAETNDLRTELGKVGVALGADIRPEILTAAQAYRTKSAVGGLAMTIAVLSIALAGFAYAFNNCVKDYRARNVVERAILMLLIASASIAILTTVGIVLSMVFETKNFFGLHSWRDFFFGTVWAPNFRGDSELAILPLLWGTIYISIIALLVAVPVGLFAAIYLSEYASRPVRSFAKPLLEILAGIPTIVYGLFALVTFGPFLLKIFGDGGFLGVNWMGDARAVATAGIVMGIMLIPFVSSLSDDIINSVPQSMRDGSYGLGATKSETIKQVVLPAALPGIVGAILLAASRAIGETMIVVLGAGAIARLSVNPLDALTTITTRIVSQLTGDGDFSSPETLVAFALGLSLFVLTLGLNVLALYIVRKYREQYE